jgi:hypothetical protein
MIALASGIVGGRQDPETVSVRLEVKDDSDEPVFSPRWAVINLRIL